MIGWLNKLVFGATMATGALAAPAPVIAPTVPMAQSPAAALLGQPATLRGTLGTTRIQMQLRLKVPIEDGIEGDYFLFGQTRKILLAGETENDILTMEESENGTDISGQWDGKIDGHTIRGTWQSADGSISKPFELTITRGTAVASKKPPSKRIARQLSH